MAISAHKRWRDLAAAGRLASPAIPASPASLGPTLALTVTLAIACFVVVMVPVELLVEPTRLPPPLNVEQKQNAETALYLLSFGLILPLALLFVPRLADSIAASPNGPGLSSLTALLAATLERPSSPRIWCPTEASSRRSWRSRSGPLSPELPCGARAGSSHGTPFCAWPASPPCSGRSPARFCSVRCWPSPSSSRSARSGSCWASSPRPRFRSPTLRLRPGALPRPSRGIGLAIDLVVIGLILLAVPDLVSSTPPIRAWAAASAANTRRSVPP